MNALIVDDEKIIVDGIKLLVEQSGYSFENLYAVCSASQALDIIRQTKIDILFTDIKMPGMDGFELIEQVRGISDAEVVLITGFAEFEYVQCALNAGALGYILKPIDEEQFFAILKKAVNKVLSRGAQAAETKPVDLQETERLLEAFFNGSSLSARERERLEHEFDTGSGYLLITANIEIAEKYEADMQTVIGEVRSGLGVYIKTKSACSRFYFFGGGRRGSLQCLCIGGSELEQMDSLCSDFYRSFKPCIPVNMYLSVSDVRNRLSHELYRHSREAYYEHFLDLDRHVLKYRASSLQVASDIENKLKLVELNINNEDMVGLEKTLNGIFSAEYIRDSGLSVRAVYFLAANAVVLTFTRIKAEVSNAVVEEILSEQYLGMIKKSVSELASRLYNIILTVLMERGQYSSTRFGIQKIVGYIDANFDKSLSVKQVSEQFGLTPNYLSQIFKKETGENFVSYLNRRRVEKACELLRQTDIKIFEIGCMVGYNDSQYFYRVFKKYMNQTPIEYRMNKN